MAAGPWALQAINAVGAVLGRLGVGATIDPDHLVRAAVRETGLRDFGGDDYREPLEVLARAANTEARLTAFGRFYATKDVRMRLCNRLRIQQALAHDPGIADERVERPVFILGLPRTGTTHLHRLLACDPDSRVPRTWEMAEPVPPPREETYETDPRISRVDRAMRAINWTNPVLRAIHDAGAREPEECISLMANDLCSVWFSVGVHVPSYERWYLSQDLTRSYGRHKLQLQLLQRHVRRDRWVLKSPIHMHGLEWLLAVYPDARIVWTHRDPAEVVPSAASLLYHFRSSLCLGIEREQVGRACLELLAGWEERGLRAREKAEAAGGCGATFVDVDYADVVRAPLQTVDRLYAAFGLRLGDEARGRMQAHLERAVQHRHGVHRYTLEEYGLDHARVAERFARNRAAA